MIAIIWNLTAIACRLGMGDNGPSYGATVKSKPWLRNHKVDALVLKKFYSENTTSLSTSNQQIQGSICPGIA